MFNSYPKSITAPGKDYMSPKCLLVSAQAIDIQVYVYATRWNLL